MLFNFSLFSSNTYNLLLYVACFLQKLQDTKNGLPPIKSQVDFDTFSINPEAHQYNRLAPLRLKSATQRRRAAMPALRPEVNPRNLTLNLGAKQYNRLQPIIPSGSGKESTA